MPLEQLHWPPQITNVRIVLRIVVAVALRIVPQEDCRNAKRRLDKENAEAMSARMDAGAEEATEKDPQVTAQLEQQLRSLQLAERNYCDMKMQNSTVYAEILHSMAHTMKLLGKVVPAAVRSGEAVLVAKNAKEHALPARNKRRKGPPLPPRAFVDSDAD
jgi:hypothetical protein